MAHVVVLFLFILLTFEKVIYFKWLPGSVADISDPKNKQSVKWNSHSFNWPVCTMAFTKPYIINLSGKDKMGIQTEYTTLMLNLQH